MKALALVLTIFGFVWLLDACTPAKQETEVVVNVTPSKDSLIKRGGYLVAALGCNDCHSPKKMGPKGPYPDSSRLLSGYPANAPIPVAGTGDIKNGLVVFSGDLTAAIGPWGTSFAANITSDATGIGLWKEEQFDQALRHGKWMGLDGTRPIMPPMPWEDFGHLNDTDVKAIFYYLKSTKPVNNVAPVFKPATKG